MRPETTTPTGTQTGSPTITTGTMRAVVQRAYGSADVLHEERIAVPAPGDHEVLLRVRAAGVDRGTWHLMTGRPHLLRLAFGVRRPRQPVPGLDVAGVVVAVGREVTRFAPGDEVFGFGSGTFAEYAVAQEQKLAPKPAGLTFEQAATVPVSASTALQAVDAGRVEAGQRVLVTGASGGVGSYVVQIAAARGAEVTGVASTAKLDLVRALGATHVVDRTHEDFADGTERFDVVVDIAGNPTLRRLRRALTPTGTAVITGGEEGGDFSGGMNRQFRALALSLVVRQRLTMVLNRQHAEVLERLATLVEDGSVTPSIGAAYPLERAADALRDLEAGRVRGKAVIVLPA